MKTAGLILLAALFVLCGFFKCAKHKQRLELRSVFVDWLGELGFSIGGKRESFTRFLARCDGAQTYAELCFTGELSKNLEATRALVPSFEKAYASSALMGVLTPHEEQTLGAVFARIEAGSAEDANRLVGELRDEICASLSTEKSEQSGKSRLLISLYSMCGFAVAVLLA